MNRRSFLQAGVVAGAVGLAAGSKAFPQQPKKTESGTSKAKGPFWPDGIRMPMSLSVMLESGGQPVIGAPGPLTADSIAPYPDMPTITWYRYGVTEGMPRMLDELDKRKIKMTSHMIGDAVNLYPQLAKEIVERGHEASGHGMSWDKQYVLDKEQETTFIANNIAAIEKATGVKPLGYNAPVLRGTIHTLGILQELGMIYHIDDVSRDEPSIVMINGKPFCIVPYSVYLNDIRAYEIRYLSTNEFAGDLKNAFDYLYEESAVRRRMCVITTHDRLLRPERVKVLREFLDYAQSKPGVKFMRKDDIAKFALSSDQTPRQEMSDVYPRVQM